MANRGLWVDNKVLPWKIFILLGQVLGFLYSNVNFHR